MSVIFSSFARSSIVCDALFFFLTLGRVEATRLDRCCCLNFSFFFSFSVENFLGGGGGDFFF